MNSSGRRKEHVANRRHAQFGFNAERSGAFFKLPNPLLPKLRLRLRRTRWPLPVWIREARSPPILIRVGFFPKHPDLARMFSEQILARKTLRHRKPLRARIDR